jgi:hypothetical protein
MPAPLPTNVGKIMRLEEWTLERLQAISFFLVVFLACAGALQLLWNFVQRDFPALPRLTFLRALAGVFLWGLLFVIVLTMISGARELMTPGAWEKQGFTYKLATAPKPPEEPNSETSRRQHLEQLRTALWHFAATHNGRFPSLAEVGAIKTALWEVPESSGMRYGYVPDLRAGYAPELLAYEPELYPDQRLVLKANGDIVMMRSADISLALSRKANP